MDVAPIRSGDASRGRCLRSLPQCSGWYDNVIWAGAPTDEKLLIDLWRSVGGGDTLSEISIGWDPGWVHADHHAIVSHPGFDVVANRTLFFGNDGRVCKAVDIRAVGTEAGLLTSMVGPSWSTST
jgi:hypothetical protein